MVSPGADNRRTPDSNGYSGCTTDESLIHSGAEHIYRRNRAGAVEHPDVLTAE